MISPKYKNNNNNNKTKKTKTKKQKQKKQQPHHLLKQNDSLLKIDDHPKIQNKTTTKNPTNNLLKENATLPKIDDNLCRAVRTEIQEHNKIKGGLPEGEKHKILDLN